VKASIPSGGAGFMRQLRILAQWLVGLVPANGWSDLIKAGIVIFVIVCALITIAWSAYFTYIIRRDIEIRRT
jgi:hypothetical protein